MVEVPALGSRLGAEALGTFTLVLAVGGTALMAAGVPDVGVGWLGVSLAAGLAVLAMAYAVGHVSGGHFNPAVTVGLAVAGRFPWRDAPAYIVTQVVAATLAATAVFVIASGAEGFDAIESGFFTNGYGDRSPGGYSLLAGLITEIVLTAIFLYIILGATDGRAPLGFAGLTIGLGLVLLHLPGIPVTNASFNPARSTGPAFFAGGEALGQLWLFWVAPVVGAAIAGATYALITGEKRTTDIAGEVRPERPDRTARGRGRSSGR